MLFHFLIDYLFIIVHVYVFYQQITFKVCDMVNHNLALGPQKG